MASVRRVCRICAQHEFGSEFLPIFGGNQTTAVDIYNICQVQIIEIPNLPALICVKCFGDLSQAVIFRNKCKETDELLREEILKMEKSSWNSSFPQLPPTINPNQKQFQDIENEEIISTIKSEPEDSENFYFDEIPIRPEVMMVQEDSSDINENNFEQNDQRERRRRRKKEGNLVDEEIDQIFPCSLCDHVLSTKKTLKYHMAVKHGSGGQNFPCKICGKVLPIKNALTRHMNRSHPKAVMKKLNCEGCHYCMKLFPTIASLKDHVKRKHEYDGREYFCNICEKSFFAKMKLAKHIRDSHVRKRKPKKKSDPSSMESYPCAVCGKVCVSKGSLHSHEKSHRVMRPSDYYYCDLCGNKFREKCPLKVHIKKRHVQKIRYVCDACPGKSWATNHQLKRHIKIYHYNIRDFKCEWCGKEFADKSKLICHIRIHTGEQPFHCKYCDAKYTHETDYRRHLYVHTGEPKKFKCQSCRRGFVNKNDLLMHRTQCNHNYY